jgi:glycosyltransferase involved in cell wall biosynthesis
MNILFISNDPRMFGPDEPVRKRMQEYAEAFGQLHIVSRAPNGASSVTEGALTLYPVQGSKLQSLVSLYRTARMLVREKGIEIVSAQDPFEHGLIAALAVRGTSAKLHLQVHTDFLSPWFTRGSFLNKLRVFLADVVLPHAHGIRVVSARIKESVRKRYGARAPEASVIPLTVGGSLPAPLALPQRAFSFTLITTGRLEPEKRIDDIITALQPLDASIGLIVLGEGKERARLEALTRARNITTRVIFMGWQKDTLALVQSADAYIQASAYEGYGRTLVEAALAKIPIISTDVGLIGEVLHPGQAALVAQPGDVQTLQKHIGALHESAELRARLIAAAAEAVKKHLQACGNLKERVRDDFSHLL